MKIPIRKESGYQPKKFSKQLTEPDRLQELT